MRNIIKLKDYTKCRKTERSKERERERENGKMRREREKLDARKKG